MHPDHPYAFMKFLFKLYQGEEKQVRLKDLEAPLRGITAGLLYEISLVLRSSLDYILERVKNNEVRSLHIHYNNIPPLGATEFRGVLRVYAGL